jgi:hypothetical protein
MTEIWLVGRTTEAGDGVTYARWSLEAAYETRAEAVVACKLGEWIARLPVGVRSLLSGEPLPDACYPKASA